MTEGAVGRADGQAQKRERFRVQKRVAENQKGGEESRIKERARRNKQRQGWILERTNRNDPLLQDGSEARGRPDRK